ncbi:MAG: radical SAM protein [Candidatus Xenobiia bacterium LiM19]
MSVENERLIGPAYAVLELTWACPAFCPGCPGDKKRLHTPMTSAQWDTVLDRLAPVVEEVRLSGGEAVNHPEFRAIVESLERRRMPFIVFTAGLWERPRQILALLKKSTMLRGLSFSVHGATEEVHDRFLSFRSFNDLLSLLAHVQKASIPFQTSTVMGDFNKFQIKEIMRLVFERGSRFHLFRRYIGPIRPGVSILRKDLHEILSYIQKVRRTGLPVEVDGCIPACFFPNSFHCNAGVTHCTVDPSGNVKACSFSGEVYGSLLETSIRRIWSGRRLRRWVSRVPADCEGCAEVSLCRGGCHALQDRFTVRYDPLMEERLTGGGAAGITLSRSFNAQADAGMPLRQSAPEMLQADLRPFALFRMRKERQGYSLILSGEVVSVPESMSWLKSEIKGAVTLSDLEARYGRDAVLFILWLHQKGFVEMNRSL